MYASLSKADIVVEEGARKVVVQTDHRDSDEIEASWELSALFAAARATNPVRGDVGEVVRFAMLCDPPERFRALVAAAGAELEVVPSGVTLPAAPDPQRLAAVLDEALRDLGKRVLADRSLAVDDNAAIALEIEFGGRGLDEDEDEVAYWTAVIELGAALGELVRARFGASWRLDPSFSSLVPCVLVHRETVVNVFGNVIRFFDRDERAAPTLLLRILADWDTSGTAMLNLRPHDWERQDSALLLPSILPHEGVDARVPLVELVRDLPSAVCSLSPAMPAAQVAALSVEAAANLAALQVETLVYDLATGPVLVVHGHTYASEKLLDRTFLLARHEQLGADLLLAAVPAKGELWLTTARAGPEHAAGFVAIIQDHFEERSDRQLSPETFVVSDGRIVGLARTPPVAVA